MDAQLVELNQKLDALTAQVTYLTEQAQRAERACEEREELFSDIQPIARDAMRLASEQLEEVEEYVKLENLLRLVKKLARATPQLEMLLDQMEGVGDLLEVAGPITRDGMDKATAVLNDMEQKGYFVFAQGGMRMLDNVVCSFNEEDVNRLGENIVLILNTVKDMTQPEIMTFVRNTLLVAEQEVQKPVNTSMMSIIRQMQDPAVRRGLALTLRVMHVIGAQAK